MKRQSLVSPTHLHLIECGPGDLLPLDDQASISCYGVNRSASAAKCAVNGLHVRMRHLRGHGKFGEVTADTSVYRAAFELSRVGTGNAEVNPAVGEVASKPRPSQRSPIRSTWTPPFTVDAVTAPFTRDRCSPPFTV
jgi:hypothetical protein